MKAYLKFGGLALSAMLTVNLFMRLFGRDVYGVSLALAALALFEGGAIAWARVLQTAKAGQRSIAKGAVWFCVIASVASSGAEIILSTGLWLPPFDLNFLTLAVIVGALAVNVLGVFAYDQSDPVAADRNKELDRQARAKREAERLEERVIDASFAKAEGRVMELAGDVSDRLAAELRDDVVGYLLAQTRNGAGQAAPRLKPAPAGVSFNGGGGVVPELAEVAEAEARQPARRANGAGPRPKAEN